MNSIKSTEHFVTLFDSNFLPQGLALHMSMERHLKDGYKLWVLCLDDRVYDNLERLSLNNVSPLKLSQLETPELLAAKTTRTSKEYCWTLTPFAPSFVFNSDNTVKRVTYLDADTWLLGDLSRLFVDFEQSGGSVFITDHAYALEHDQSMTSGKYCVQFMTFTRGEGDEVRDWWESKCLEWCYSRIEEGKFGDQKYLEQFPELFPNKVYIAKDLDNFMAPWNAIRFSTENAVLWHFHGLRIIRLCGSLRAYFGDYFLPEIVLKDIYKPYIQDIVLALAKLKEYGVPTPVQSSFGWKVKIKYFLARYCFQKDQFLLKNLIRL